MDFKRQILASSKSLPYNRLRESSHSLLSIFLNRKDQGEEKMDSEIKILAHCKFSCWID